MSNAIRCSYCPMTPLPGKLVCRGCENIIHKIKYNLKAEINDCGKMADNNPVPTPTITVNGSTNNVNPSINPNFNNGPIYERIYQPGPPHVVLNMGEEHYSGSNSASASHVRLL